MLRRSASLAFVVLLLICAQWAKAMVQEGEAERTLGRPVVVVPAPVAHTLALGYDTVAADIYWLRLLEYFGDKRYRSEHFSSLVPLLDLVVTLDPKFCIVYRQAGLILTSSEITDLEAANRLLYRGVDACPEDYYIPFVLGFNLFFFDKRFTEAGAMLTRAAERPGAPDWLGDLAIRVSAHGGDLDSLDAMLAVMAEGEKDDRARATIERRRAYVGTERLLRRIDRAAEEAAAAGHSVKNLDDLVALGLVPATARDPSGGTLSWTEGQAHSSVYPNRLDISPEALK